jgi:outer membrane lipoprotein-sorting protein
MPIRRLYAIAILALALAPAVPARAALPPLSAEQIVEKNVAARGGLAAWRGVKTLSWKGKMTAGGATYVTVVKGKLQTKERPEAELPFALELKRPDKSRLELDFAGTTAVQVYDGTTGWKLRPYLGHTEAEPFTADELKQVQDEPGIDGYLIDYAAKGAKVQLAGTDKVEGRDCYKLKVTSKSGHARHVWVDGQTFLDAKIEGDPRKLDGKPHVVEVYPREFRAEQGLMIPHLLETAVQGVKGREKITIESVAVNPALEDKRFAKPAPAR